MSMASNTNPSNHSVKPRQTVSKLAASVEGLVRCKTSEAIAEGLSSGDKIQQCQERRKSDSGDTKIDEGNT